MTISAESAAGAHARKVDPDYLKGVDTDDGSPNKALKLAVNGISTECFKNEPPLIRSLWYMLGLAEIFLFSAGYYLAPVLVVGNTVYLIKSRGCVTSLITTGAMLVLLFAPAPRNFNISRSKAYQAMGLYFEGEAYQEIENDREARNYPKPVVFLAFPHGTISYGGIVCGSLAQARNNVTATVDILMRTPLLRHMLGVFGLVSGSRSALRHVLRDLKEDVVIYPGGLAELFLSSPEKEVLYFKNRKGCVKLAMECGCDVRVIYIFGHTRIFRVLCSKACAKLSRLLKVSITVFWGRWGLPFPNRTKLICIQSKPIEMPDYSKNPSGITLEVLNEQHERIQKELLRVFNAYKHMHPDYANKELNII